MTIADLPLLLALPVLVALSAFCSASETAFFGLTYHDRLRLKRASPKAAAVAASLLARPDALLVTILLCNTTVNTLVFIISSVLLLRAENPAVGVAINAGSVVGLVIFGEVLPKLLAGSGRVKSCRALGRPLLALHRTLTPVHGTIRRGVVAPLARLVRPSGSGGGAPTLTVEELSALVQQGTVQGTLDPGEGALLAQVVELGTLRVREIMTPRVRMALLNEDATAEQIAEAAATTGLTRIPVRVSRRTIKAAAGGIDEVGEVRGFLRAKRYLAAHASGVRSRVSDHLLPARYVPDSARLDRLLEHFRATRTQVALCVDEFGSVVGLVQIEDVVRRLVNEISPTGSGTGDTASDAEGAGAVQMIGLGRWLVPGRLSVRDWSATFGRAGGGIVGGSGGGEDGQDGKDGPAAADPRVTTLAGLIQASLGRIPRAGDTLTLANVRIEVQAMARNTVDRVVVSLAGAEGTP